MEPLLEIRNYSVSFWQYDRGWNRKCIDTVKNLNLKLNAGEVVAIVGESGSGKSLLAHGILGILPYNARMQGKLYYRGEELTEEKIRKLRGNQIVLIPQSASFLDPLMKVGSQIVMGSRKQTKKDKMRKLLKQYHLEPEIEEKYPFELSGGMTRRVLLTMAQMGQPKVVIADEPTPGLQKEMAALALGHLREMARQGAGVLLITHDLEQALVVADRIVVFYEGETIEETDAAAFLQEETLKHPYTKALWRAMPQNGFQVREEEDQT